MSLLSNSCLLSPKVLSNLIHARKEHDNRRTSALGEQRTGVLLSCVSQALSTEGMQIRARGVLGLIETLHGCISHGHKAQLEGKNAYMHSSSAGMLLSAGSGGASSGIFFTSSSAGLPIVSRGSSYASLGGRSGASASLSAHAYTPSEAAKRSWNEAIEDDMDEIELREMMEEEALMLRDEDAGSVGLRNRGSSAYRGDSSSLERRRAEIEMRLHRIRHAKMARIQVPLCCMCCLPLSLSPLLMCVYICMCRSMYLLTHIHT